MDKESRKAMGKILRELRLRRGLSLDDASHRISKSQSWLSMLERGQLATPFETLDELLSLYDYSWAEFIRAREEFQQREDPQNGSIFFRNGIKCAAAISPDRWKYEEMVEGMRYGISPVLIDQRILDATPLVIKPKGSTGIIRSQTEQVWYIVEGRILVEFFDKSEEEPSFQRELTTDCLVQLQPSVRHRVTNNSESEAHLLVVRSSIMWRELSAQMERHW